MTNCSYIWRYVCVYLPGFREDGNAFVLAGCRSLLPIVLYVLENKRKTSIELYFKTSKVHLLLVS